jgi:hypothetical protein
MLGPSLFGLTFAWSVRHPALNVPGLAMELAAAAMLGCLLLGLRAGRRPTAAPAVAG